jgi:hypothetical protein
VSTKSAILIFLFVTAATILAVRGCWQRGHSAYFQAIIWGSCAFTWSPEKMAHHQQQTASIVRDHLIASHLWNAAGWSIIGMAGLLFIFFRVFKEPTGLTRR